MIKKVFLFLIIIFIPGILTAQLYFKSNMIGMRLAPVEADEVSGFEWHLEVSDDAEDSEVSILYHEGRIYSRKTVSVSGGKSVETLTKADVTEISVREDGLVISEESRNSDGTDLKTVYSYSGADISEVTSYENETRLYTDRYLYSAGGRLLDVKREYTDSDDSSLMSFLFTGGNIKAYLISMTKKSSLLVYDDEGRLKLEEVKNDQTVTKIRRISRDSRGSREVIENSTDGTVTTLTFNFENLLIREDQRDSDGIRIKTVDFTYKDGKTASIIRTVPGTVEKEFFTNDNEGILISELYMRNGNRIREINYTDENSYSEIFYRNGRPSVEIKYENDDAVEVIDLISGGSSND